MAPCETAGVIGLGAPELLIVMMLFLLGPALCIWAAVDAAGQPDWAFEAAGTSKNLWIVLPIVGIFVCFVGLVAALMWFTTFRPRVRDAANRGPRPAPP
jgi:hypothetical protein